MKRGRSLRLRPAPTLPAGRLAPLALAAAAQLLCLQGCKTSITSTPRDGGSGGGGGGGGGRDGGSPIDRMVSGSDAPADLQTSEVNLACAKQSSMAESIPLDLYFIMDSSRSMEVATAAGPTKWDSVRTALGNFFGDATSAGISIGMVYFPEVNSAIADSCASDAACGAAGGVCDRRVECVRTGNTLMQPAPAACTIGTSTGCAATETCTVIQDCGGGTYCGAGGPTATCPAGCMPFAGYCHNRDSCDLASYATPDVPIAELPAAAAGIATSLMGRKLDGFTPTGAAMRGAIQYAQTRAAAMRNRKLALVLVTDGLPGGFVPGLASSACPNSTVDEISLALSEAARGVAPGGTAPTLPQLPTFVIGVFAPGNEANMAPMALNKLAAGGNAGMSASDTAVIISTDSNVTAMLQAALNGIRTRTTIACEYQIPAATEVEFDKMRVNVDFTKGDGTVARVPNRMDASKCDAQGGWFYDNNTTPTKITACEVTCNQFQGETSGHVDIVFGCPIVTIM